MKVARVFLIAAGLMLTVSASQAARYEIYPAPAQSRANLAAALKQAPVTHKRILLDFGGNWCLDCVILDRYFHNATNRPILEANFILVHINVGRYDANLDLAKKYEIPLKQGVPALAVLTEKGKLLYSQKYGQFEAMRSLQPSDATKFLLQWKPVKPGCSAVRVTC